MQLEELRARELTIRKACVDQLKGKKGEITKIDFNLTGTKINIGEQELSTWVTFFVTASLMALSLCFIAFGDTKASVCAMEISPTVETLCVGWQLLFMLTFSIIILPITLLIGTIEFFQHIKEETSSTKDLSEQFKFQENFNIVSKVLVYSLFILAVQIFIHFNAFHFLPDILKLPFIVFDTDFMLPIALALLYYTVSKKSVFYSVSSRFLYMAIFLNLVSVVFSRGVRLVWEVSVGKFFLV